MTNQSHERMTDAKPLPDRTFEYLLNAMERAAQADNPGEHGYAAKRKAVFAHVEALRADVERLRAAVERMRFAALVADWHEFDAAIKDTKR